MVSSSCSGRLAPTIGDVIAGLRSTHATAIVGNGEARLDGELDQLVDGVEHVVVPVAVLVGPRRVPEREARALLRRLALRSCLPDSRPPGDRVVRDHADALVEAQREQLPLELAEDRL